LLHLFNSFINSDVDDFPDSILSQGFDFLDEVIGEVPMLTFFELTY